MTQCTSCDAALSSALVCESCGALQDAAGADAWSVFALEPAYEIDAEALKQRLLALQRRMHPDFFGGAAAAERERAELNTAELNAAHRTLSDDVRRAHELLRYLGGPDEQEERQMPQAFLMEVLEWNETLDEARDAAPGSPERAALDPLERQLRAERAAALERIAALLTPLPPRRSDALTHARRELNAIRYLDRALHTLGELRLDAARSTR